MADTKNKQANGNFGAFVFEHEEENTRAFSTFFHYKKEARKFSFYFLI